MKRFLLLVLTGLMLCAAIGINAEPVNRKNSGQNLTTSQKGQKKMKQSKLTLGDALTRKAASV